MFSGKLGKKRYNSVALWPVGNDDVFTSQELPGSSGFVISCAHANPEAQESCRVKGV